jgi:hypothetical protein
MHPASPAHDATQLPLVASHTYGAQSTPFASSMHVPRPSQTRPVAWFDAHTLAPHDVPLVYLRHAAAPSHVPSRAHESAPSSGQSSWGSRPLFTGPHVPLVADPVSAAVHATQNPLHGRSQHTPSAHVPEAHVPPSVHAWPAAVLHAPVASQVCAPAHVSGSSAFFTGRHVPRVADCEPTGRLHASHVPQALTSQHTPSTQKPDAQSDAAMHVPPRVVERYVPAVPHSTMRPRAASNAIPPSRATVGGFGVASNVHVAPSHDHVSL